jgi:hypothetical protein
MHVGATQTPLVQTPDWQSEAAAHFFPVPHFGHAGPPQSVSVSPSFLTPSWHVGVAHVPPALQKPLAQSAPTEQCLPSAHGAHAPPQSMSVSVPFMTPSTQLAATQIPAAHTPLAQSRSRRHALPFAHPGQLDPPQSTSVSVPFRAPSVHVGGAHTPLELQ